MADELPSPEERVGAVAATGTTQLLERAVLLLLFAGLVIGVLAVLRPFATAILFGTILAIAAWPLREFLLRRGLKRGLDATLLLLLALAVVVLPLIAVAPGLAERLTQGANRLQDYLATTPRIPSWLTGLPIVGERLARIWDQAVLAEGGIRAFLEPYSDALRHAFVGTAVIQAVIMAIGLAVAGVPGGVLLGFVTLLLALSQIGAPLIIVVWGGAAYWLFAQDQQGWGVFMIFWGLVVSVIDNFIKPLLIGVGVAMPLSLTILGVFGGFVAFGFLGLFIGPTLIAIAFTLLEAWRSAPAAQPEQPSDDATLDIANSGASGS